MRALEEVDVVGVGLPVAEGVGDAAARERARERLGARGVQARVAAVEEGRVGADGQQQREDRAHAVRDPDGAVGAAHADVDVQRERVVAPHDVPQLLVQAAVVLGVDDALLAVVGPRVGAGRPERDPALGGQREEAPAQVALGGDRVGQRLAAARADLDLRRDQLAGDRRGEDRIGLRAGAQVLEARHELQRRGVEDRELLLEADGEVGRALERLAGAFEVDQVR